MTTENFYIEIDPNNDAERRFFHVWEALNPNWTSLFAKHFRTDLKLRPAEDGNNAKFEFLVAKKEQEKIIRNGYAILLNAYRDGKHVDGNLIQDIAAQVFTGATNDNNSGGKVQIDFNNGVQPSKGGWGSGKKNKDKKPAKPYFFSPRNAAQKDLVNLIAENDVTFAIGPAGTGKTHVAVAMAVEAFKNNEIEKILLARPAIGTGKDLGALPGGIEEKLAPFMRPLYDELIRALGSKQRLEELVEDGTIEIAPVEFMRGRTFRNAFVIVDEVQNCTKGQITMALTRIGEGSKMVITGDPMQVDLKEKEDPGLNWAIAKLQGTEGIGFQHFNAEDVVRHPVVARIVKALEGEGEEIRKPRSVSNPNP